MRKTFFTLILISILLILLDKFSISDNLKEPVEPLIVRAKKNIYRGFSQLKYLPKIIFNYNEITSAINKSRLLESENDQMRLKITELNEENLSLRKQLSSPLSYSFRFIPANVIALSRQLEIDVGRKNGVKPGMPVIDGVILIGKISKTTDRRSEVLLLSDNELTVPAITNRGARGQISGIGGHILFNQVLQKDPLFLEDIVLTSGEEGYPSKLLIGKINRIKADEREVYKEAQVTPYTDFSLIKKVYVIEER